MCLISVGAMFPIFRVDVFRGKMFYIGGLIVQHLGRIIVIQLEGEVSYMWGVKYHTFWGGKCSIFRGWNVVHLGGVNCARFRGWSVLYLRLKVLPSGVKVRMKGPTWMKGLLCPIFGNSSGLYSEGWSFLLESLKGVISYIQRVQCLTFGVKTPTFRG